MSNINLLPTDLGPDPKVAKVSEKVVRIGTFLTAFLFVLIAVSIASFALLSNRIKESENNKNNLRSSITSLEDTEQKLILLKDRIEKSSTVMAADTAINQVEEIEGLMSTLPAGVSIVQSEVYPARTEILFSAPDSNTVVDLVQLIESSGRFRTVELSSIVFSNIKGYEVALVLLK